MAKSHPAHPAHATTTKDNDATRPEPRPPVNPPLAAAEKTAPATIDPVELERRKDQPDEDRRTRERNALQERPPRALPGHDEPEHDHSGESGLFARFNPSVPPAPPAPAPVLEPAPAPLTVESVVESLPARLEPAQPVALSPLARFHAFAESVEDREYTTDEHDAVGGLLLEVVEMTLGRTSYRDVTILELGIAGDDVRQIRDHYAALVARGTAGIENLSDDEIAVLEAIEADLELIKNTARALRRKH